MAGVPGFPHSPSANALGPWRKRLRACAWEHACGHVPRAAHDLPVRILLPLRPGSAGHEKSPIAGAWGNLAEEVGFEPTEPCGSTVFKTAAFNHSAIPP